MSKGSIAFAISEAYWKRSAGSFAARRRSAITVLCARCEGAGGSLPVRLRGWRRRIEPLLIKPDRSIFGTIEGGAFMRELYVDDIAAQKDRHYDESARGRHHRLVAPAAADLPLGVRRPVTEELCDKPPWR